jgi:hypothetical protein
MVRPFLSKFRGPAPKANRQELQRPCRCAAAGTTKNRFNAVEFLLSQWYNQPIAKKR